MKRIGLDLVAHLGDAAVVAYVANAHRPTGRLGVARRLDLPDDRWATMVHPAASLAEGSILGSGTVLLAGVVVTAPLRIGAQVVAMPHVVLKDVPAGEVSAGIPARRIRAKTNS